MLDPPGVIAGVVPAAGAEVDASTFPPEAVDDIDVSQLVDEEIKLLKNEDELVAAGALLEVALPPPSLTCEPPVPSELSV